MRALAPLLLVLACHVDDPDDHDSDVVLRWYETCGDPVCSTWRGPTDGVPACVDQTDGATCPDAGARCDLQTDCNTFLVCAGSDPKADPGGCPISRAAAKKQIAYLDDRGVRAAADAALRTRLATWRYRWEDDADRLHLGFVIDDQPTGSPAVLPDGDHVDLYGYTSLALAAVQAQQAELDALRAEVAALKAELARRR